MKTFTVEFRQQQPGKMKKVPVLIRGIEVADGRLIPVTVVPVGSYDAKCWEVPFMRGNYPDEAWIGGGRKIFDAHPVRGEQTRGRPVLAKPHIGSFDNGRVLILINTEAGDEKGKPDEEVFNLRDGDGQTSGKKEHHGKVEGDQ